MAPSPSFKLVFSQPDEIWFELTCKTAESNLSRSDLKHVCRWFNSAISTTTQIEFQVGVDLFFFLLSSVPKQYTRHLFATKRMRRKTQRQSFSDISRFSFLEVFIKKALFCIVINIITITDAARQMHSWLKRSPLGFFNTCCWFKLDLKLCVWIHVTSPHQLLRQHPPPKPPASLSTVTTCSSPTLYIPWVLAPPLHSPLHTTQYRGEERRRGGEQRRREMERWRSAGVWGWGWPVEAHRVTTLTLSLSLCFSFSLLPPFPLSPNVGFLSPCLTAVCQTIPLSPLWGTGWMPSRWAATVTTLSTQDLLPLTWWPRWQQSEWSYSGLQRLSGTEIQSQIKNT